MKSIEACLDMILKELVKNWERPNNERYDLNGEELLRQFGLPSLMQKHEFFNRLIYRLIEDGYAEKLKNYNNHPMSELAENEKFTIITIEGYYFINGGGYSVELRKKEDAEANEGLYRERAETLGKRLAEWTKTLANRTSLLMVATWFVAAGAVGLVVWEIWHSYHSGK